MDIKRKLTTAIAAGALLLNFVTPIAAETIQGNNTNSSNYINTDIDSDFDLDQQNDADVENSVNISLDSGGNKVKDVVGGEVEVKTGDIEAGVQLLNQLNMNVAAFETCGSCGLAGDFKIANNNSKTDNDIEYDYDNDVDLDQDNDADVENDVDVIGTSGDNKVEDTMSGSVKIDSGDVSVNPIIIKNALNANWAVVTSSNDEEDGISAWILGNNSDSDNFINIDVDHDLDLDQDNDADVENDVAVKAESGDNKVDDVVGAEISLETGEVEVGVMIDTMANFNLAAVEDCCFLGDRDLKIADNNVDSDNDIEVDIDLDYDLDQDNDFDCGGYGDKYFPLFEQLLGGKDKDCNEVDVTGGTGDNEVEDATAGGHDPEIDTGDAAAAVSISNSANVNVEGGSELDFDVDFGEVADMLEDLFDLLD